MTSSVMSRARKTFSRQLSERLRKIPKFSYVRPCSLNFVTSSPSIAVSAPPPVRRQFTTTTYYKAASTRNVSSSCARKQADENPSLVINYEEPFDVAEEKSYAHDQSIKDTPIGNEGVFLLDGLDVYSVPALGDHHPLAVYGLDSLEPPKTSGSSSSSRFPVLLLHGRTWSSVPVYHLLGGDLSKNPLVKPEEGIEEGRSLMEALVNRGLQPYAMDFRGFGGTPSDESGYVQPLRCVRDVETVLLWIAQQHNNTHVAESVGTATVSLDSAQMPALFGWSQGAMVAQLAAQQHPSAISKLILYGSIWDPLFRYPREPLYRINEPNKENRPNTFNDAIEDFTIQGTIPPEPARMFAEAALVADPIKAVWKHLYQFNNLDPARVDVPTLVIAGDQDPYAPLRVQQELFCNLGRGSDRTWSILVDADHAAHILDNARHRFTNIVSSFIQNCAKRDAFSSRI